MENKAGVLVTLEMAFPNVHLPFLIGKFRAKISVRLPGGRFRYFANLMPPGILLQENGRGCPRSQASDTRTPQSGSARSGRACAKCTGINQTVQKLRQRSTLTGKRRMNDFESYQMYSFLCLMVEKRNVL